MRMFGCVSMVAPKHWGWGTPKGVKNGCLFILDEFTKMTGNTQNDTLVLQNATSLDEFTTITHPTSLLMNLLTCWWRVPAFSSVCRSSSPLRPPSSFINKLLSQWLSPGKRSVIDQGSKQSWSGAPGWRPKAEKRSLSHRYWLPETTELVKN